MIVLGIDTAAVTCSVALYGDRLLAKKSVTGGPTHSTTLLPFIKEVLQEASLSLSEVDVIAISSGPGSFTGLRIGISTVKGLAVQKNIPCAAVSTLMALAQNASDFEGKIVCPVMDARRGEFYNALFLVENGALKRITEDRAISGEILREELKAYDDVLILGDGAEKFVSTFEEFLSCLAEESIRCQDGESVAKIGLELAKENKMISCHSLSPGYLRLPQAEREWLLKNKQNVTE